MAYPRKAFRGGAMLYEAARLVPDPALLDPASYGDDAHAVQEGGRQAAWFVHGPGWQGVLRGYRRGGLIARVSRQRYIWAGEEQTRCFREFRLLARMQAAGLPVPAPLAAAYWRDGLTYRAAILVERLPNVRPLAADPSAQACEAAGRAIAAMHAAGVWHADLNAFNILLDPAGRAWLIDFDRGRDGGISTAQRQANLQRLQRSLLKVCGAAGQQAWEAICLAYRASGS
ncbi:lipopolysaccharide kinase, Kdo/WaaP family [Bordetella holmesii CDC-H635-BH]|nr:lipopolysaccharide kinase, Kdo/WaaP family [Bordetella holmesii CDC-H635-BH]